jgi:hypothetical protein
MLLFKIRHLLSLTVGFCFSFSSRTYMLKATSEVQEALNVVVDGQETSLKVQLAIKDSIDELAKSTKPKSREGMIYVEQTLFSH